MIIWLVTNYEGGGGATSQFTNMDICQQVKEQVEAKSTMLGQTNEVYCIPIEED